MEDHEVVGRNKCACNACRDFRTRRARMGARAMWANPANDPRFIGSKGADGLLARFRREVRANAKRQGIKLSPASVNKRATLLRDNHLSRIAMDRHRNERSAS